MDSNVANDRITAIDFLSKEHGIPRGELVRELSSHNTKKEARKDAAAAPQTDNIKHKTEDACYCSIQTGSHDLHRREDSDLGFG